ncbi:hypothetical protein [Mesobacillus harenae]|uniref:hypothetical protein n=1 Tax=Mesobacillus harenae TaxID=2213203 RepID=UPI00158106C7|nr:hypothetical protein [Mesobacillus harenae]
MTPQTAIFLILPMVTIAISTFLKRILTKVQFANFIVILSIYFFSNISLFMLIEGAFPGIEIVGAGNKINLFTDLAFRQWLDALLVPNTFTFLYIIISYAVLLFLDKQALWKERVGALIRNHNQDLS